MTEIVPKPITKTEAAGRQLDTAIDLYFNNADSLAIHTLAYASFKVLFDLYPHRKEDDFAEKLDKMITVEGWRAFSSPANFLKHADRDPNAVLTCHHPHQAMAIIGLATLLYRRICGDFTRKMRAFDCWIEVEGHDQLGIVEVDTNENRATEHKTIRDVVRELPHQQKMIVAQKLYQHFLENFDRYATLNAEGDAAGLSITEILDRLEAKKEA